MSIPPVIRPATRLAGLTEAWSPRVVAELNDYQIKLARLDGEFVWHQHDDTDELFLVIKGDLEIDFPDGTAALTAGDLLVVPRRLRHRPRAARACAVLLIEPRGVVNTGDAGGPLTAEQNRWI